MNKQIEEYLIYLKSIKNYSNHTIDSYRSDLELLENFLDNNKVSYKSINKELILDYLKKLDEEGYTNTSISRQIASFRGFYHYLEENKLIDCNPFLKVHNPKTKRRLPSTLNYEEIRKLLDEVELKTPRDYMEHAIFELLYATGIRVSELTSLEEKNIDFKEMTIRVTGKGNKERIVFFGEYAKEALLNYLKVRDELNIKNSKNLFINKKGGVLSRNSVYEILKNRVEKLCIGHPVSPHTLRHTFATDMLQNGASIRTVQELLGHEKLSTTQIYTHLTQEYVRKEYLDKMPRR